MALDASIRLLVAPTEDNKLRLRNLDENYELAIPLQDKRSSCLWIALKLAKKISMANSLVVSLRILTAVYMNTCCIDHIGVANNSLCMAYCRPFDGPAQDFEIDGSEPKWYKYFQCGVKGAKEALDHTGSNEKHRYGMDVSLALTSRVRKDPVGIRRSMQ